MEKHKQNLLDTCRICGNRIKLDKSYSTAKLAISFSVIIKHLFNCDIEKDFPLVHPKHICSSCRRKLSRCDSTFTTTYQLPDFRIHSDDHCLLCLKQKSKVKGFVLQSEEKGEEVDVVVGTENPITKYALFKMAEEHRFVHIEQCNEAYRDKFCFAKINFENNHPVVLFSFSITLSGSWTLYAYEKKIENNPYNMESTLDADSLKLFFTNIDISKICPGNDDFPLIIEKKHRNTEALKDKDGNIKACIENDKLVDMKEGSTIRHVNCKLIIMVYNERCEVCSEYRKTLNVKRWRIENVEKTTSKYTPNIKLGKEELQQKVHNLSKEVRLLRQSKQRLQSMIGRAIENEGQIVSEPLHKVCAETLKGNQCSFPSDSVQYLLWSQQEKQASCKNPKSMRWHPVMLRWCISIYLKSPGAYQHLRDSGFLSLPHKSTIQMYTNFTKPSCGFNVDVLKLLVEETKNFDANGRKVGIIFDEMKIKSGLVYSRHTGQLIGFSDTGNMNAELNEFRQRIEKDENILQFATHVITFMVRGICSSLAFPFAYFAGQGFTSHQLYASIWEAVKVLEAVNLQVYFFTSDGATPNRRFYRLHLFDDCLNKSDDGVVFWCYNKYAPISKPRKIYFICDVPHLMKTVRNNMENSHAHNNTRNLMIKSKQISWQHIISLLEYDLSPERAAPGLRQTKLTTDHVYLTPRSRMNVSLAVQVLSKSVRICLQSQGHSHTESTQTLCMYFNKFFDCLNVKSRFEGVRKRNSDLLPFTSLLDERLLWLKDIFLNFINDWEKEGDEIVGLNKDEKNRLCLSKQTIEGLRITVHSVVNLVPELLSVGVEYILTDKLNQDPVEEHFGRQRMKSGANDNPTLQEYGQNELKLQVAKSDMLRVMKGNTRGKNLERGKIDIHEMKMLPKRPRKKKDDNQDDK